MLRFLSREHSGKLSCQRVGYLIQGIMRLHTEQTHYLGNLILRGRHEHHIAIGFGVIRGKTGDAWAIDLDGERLFLRTEIEHAPPVGMTSGRMTAFEPA